MAVTLGQLGMQRHHAGLTNDIFARPFDQEITGSRPGARAAAEAANIAASLGGLPDLGMPSMGGFQTGGHIPTGVNGMQGYSVMPNNGPIESRVQDRMTDVTNAPPPLPRLSGFSGMPNGTGAMRFSERPQDTMIGGDARFEKPVEATVHEAELALAAAHRMAAAERERVGGSAGSSWVAPPIETFSMQMENGYPTSSVPPLRINDPGLMQPPTQLMQQQTSVSAPPATWDTRQVNMERYFPDPYAANGFRPTYQPETNLPPSTVPASLRPVELVAQESRRPVELVERPRPMTPPAVYERPMTPRQVMEQGQVQTMIMQENSSLPPNPQGYFAAASRQASVPQLSFEGERPGRSRSVPMTPNSRLLAGYFPPATTVSGYISPVPAVASYACPVWPPPPLPPVSCELTARLDALEAQKITAMDKMRETRLDKIRGELDIAQAAASQCKLLEQQLEQCNAEWKVKFDLLEARCKQSEAAASSRIAQAVRDAEAKSREEVDILRKELQVVRAEGDRALEESQLRSQDQIERLKRELQEARMLQRNDPNIEKLRAELEIQKDELSKKTEELRTLELRNIGLSDQLRNEKAEVDSRNLELLNQRNGYEVELTVLRERTEDLLREIAMRRQERDTLESDLQNLKNASKQREEECNKLRETLKEEKREVTLLQAEVQSSKAAMELGEAKERLFSPRQSGASRQSVMSGQMMIDVDMTEDMEVPRRSSRSSGEVIRRQLGSQTMTTRYVVEEDY